MKPIFAALVAVSLAACASGPKPEATFTIAQKVYGKALFAAAAYASLPRCTSATPGGVSCSVPSTVAAFQDAQRQAKSDMAAANVAVADSKIDETDKDIIARAYDSVYRFRDKLGRLQISVEE